MSKGCQGDGGGGGGELCSFSILACPHMVEEPFVLVDKQFTLAISLDRSEFSSFEGKRWGSKKVT